MTNHKSLEKLWDEVNRSGYEAYSDLTTQNYKALKGGA